MPFIMDDQMQVDIDDLFDDTPGLALASKAPPKELLERLDELRGSGCCQAIAYSRYGVVASITADGRTLQVRNLRVDPRDGRWNMSEASAIPDLTATRDGGLLKHLCWSPNGSDLAVYDAAGRVCILSIATSLSRPVTTRPRSMDSIDESHRVVGAHWLNIGGPKPVQIQSHAVRQGNSFAYEMSQAIAPGPVFPIPRPALVSVTTNGTLRLIYFQTLENKWHEITSEIESISSSDELITHASLCPDKDQTLLLAITTASRQLRLLRVYIGFTEKKATADQRPGAPQQSRVTAQMKTEHLVTTNLAEDVDASTEGHGHLSGLPQATMPISHLLALSPSPETRAQAPQGPRIIAVRSMVAGSGTNYGDEQQSIIDEWDISAAPASLHLAFKSLNPKGEGTKSSTRDAWLLTKKHGPTINKVIIRIEPIQFDTTLCFAYSDGSIEYRDRENLALLPPLEGNARFSHLTQAGLTYADTEPCLYSTLSATALSAVQLGADGQLKWRPLKSDVADSDAPREDPRYSTVVAGLNLALSTAVMTGASYDDILAVASHMPNLTGLAYDLLCQLSRTLRFTLDFSEDQHHDGLIRNHPLQVCLGVQNSMGYHGETLQRSFAAKLAWMTLQLRFCTVLYAMALNVKVTLQEPPHRTITGLEDADAIRIISGWVKWCLDFQSWLIDALDDDDIFAEAKAGQQLDMAALSARIIESKNVALHVLLASSTRGLLIAICRRLIHLDYTARKAINAVNMQNGHGAPFISNTLRQSYTAIAALTNASVIRCQKFEKLLESISAAVKNAYQAANLPSGPPPLHTPPKVGEATRNAIEQQILFGEHLPRIFAPVVAEMFSTMLPKLKADIDPSELFFHDYSLLGLPDANAPETLAQLEGLPAPRKQQLRKQLEERAFKVIDVLTKTPKDMRSQDHNGKSGRAERRFKRCARCAAAMEDTIVTRPSAANYLISQQRRCYCNGNWNILPAGKAVA